MTVQPNAKLLANLRWFLDNVDDPPTRIHVRGIWHDETGASAFGAPMLAADFARWLELGVKSVRTELHEVPCFHVGVPDGDECLTCGGEGVVRRERVIYRWPMRAALAKVEGIRVPSGAPDYARTCSALQRANGDVDLAVEMLTTTYPAMGDPEFALDHIASALNRVRSRFGIEALDTKPREKSEAQLDAEAVA